MTKICPYCNRVGHLRRTHFDCAVNLHPAGESATKQQIITTEIEQA
jgi:hypothetical protein